MTLSIFSYFRFSFELLLYLSALPFQFSPPSRPTFSVSLSHSFNRSSFISPLFSLFTLIQLWSLHLSTPHPHIHLPAPSPPAPSSCSSSISSLNGVLFFLLLFNILYLLPHLNTPNISSLPLSSPLSSSSSSSSLSSLISTFSFPTLNPCFHPYFSSRPMHCSSSSLSSFSSILLSSVTQTFLFFSFLYSLPLSFNLIFLSSSSLLLNYPPFSSFAFLPFCFHCIPFVFIINSTIYFS